jgi:hypothetical protein
MVLILCLYRYSTGRGMLMVLCPDGITPCPMAILLMQRRLHWHWGAISTSSKHLLVPLCQQNIVQKHRFSLTKQCGTGTILVGAFAAAAGRIMKIRVML